MKNKVVEVSKKAYDKKKAIGELKQRIETLESNLNDLRQCKAQETPPFKFTHHIDPKFRILVQKEDLPEGFYDAAMALLISGLEKKIASLKDRLVTLEHDLPF